MVHGVMGFKPDSGTLVMTGYWRWSLEWGCLGRQGAWGVCDVFIINSIRSSGCFFGPVTCQIWSSPVDGGWTIDSLRTSSSLIHLYLTMRKADTYNTNQLSDQAKSTGFCAG